PPRQGHRPDGRGRVTASNAGRFEARSSRRARPAHHPAEDRTRSAEKESDEASKDRLQRLEQELANLEQESAAITQRWQAEKEKLGAASKLKEQLDQARFDLETAQRRGDLAKAGELAYGVIPELEKKLREAEAAGRSAGGLVEEEVTPQ